MEINRNEYLDRLVGRRNNGLIKIITGIRRCGKSYLLDPIFRNYLINEGVPDDHIIKIELDRITNRKFHKDPEAFNTYIHSLIKDNGSYYLLLDEIQLVEDFELVLNGLLYEKNLDVYVTGSNSRFLSSDIISEFRGRGDQIHLNPLSFSEFYSACGGDKTDCWNEYLTYGGMPLILSKSGDAEKSEYLKDLFAQTYFTDIVNRNGVKRTDVLDSVVDILASSVGSLTNPQKIYETFKSRGEKELSINTVNSYLAYLEDSFIIKKALRYDVKGRKYINTPQKYYFSDVGLRNARLNFRQQEETHLMENVIYNELVFRGYNVDVGVVEIREAGKHVQTEVDFVCNMGSNRVYIQSALNLSTPEKTKQESRSLNHIRDSFKKIIVVKDNIKRWRTDDGILVLGVTDFLLDPGSMAG
ncbi:MAG: ATP-binding protein [Blautia sp.]|nr:ATP-binding protein [Blautia sp.]